MKRSWEPPQPGEEITAAAALMCCQCGATQTPQWREGPQGPKTLCNACGVKWYRQAKRSRKSGGHGSTTRQRQQRVAAVARHARPVGDSGDELTVAYCTMSDHSSEDTEEQLAALSLLWFAGVQPQDLEAAPALGVAAGQQELRPEEQAVKAEELEVKADEQQAPAGGLPKAEEAAVDAAEATGAGACIPASMPEAAGPAEQQKAEPAPHSSTAPDPAVLMAQPAAVPAPSKQPSGIPLLVAQLPTAQVECLRTLQEAVQQAFREVQAAEAATVAVSQFLREKEAQARSARDRAHLAECMLLEQMRQLDAQFRLTRQHKTD